MNNMKSEDITMSFPTWNDISQELGITTFSIENFGNKPYSKKDPLWGIYVTNNIFNKDTKYGIDIPVLLEPQTKNDKVIMILGESALRKKNQLQDLDYNVFLGTPYAVHLTGDNYPKDCEVYKLIFDGLLEKGYSLYLTDIIKVWSPDMKMQPGENDISIFRKELNNLTIDCIITFGNTAKKALESLRNQSQVNFPKVIELLHPCKNAWIHWKLKIFEDAVFKKDISYAKKYYKLNETGHTIPKNEMTPAEIVAKVALEEIDVEH